MGADGFGIYSFSLAIIMLISIPTTVGIPELMVRETAKLVATKNWSLLRGLWTWGFRQIKIFSILVVVVAILTIYFWAIYNDSAINQSVLLGLIVIPIMAITTANSACIRGLKYTTLGQLPDNLVRTLSLMIMIFTIYFLSIDLQPLTAISLYIMASAIAMCVSMYILQRVKPNQVTSNFGITFDILLWKKAVLPLSLITGLQVINGYTDIIVLGMFSSNTEIGVYRGVVQISLLVSFGLQAINQVLHPNFSSLYAQNELEKLQKLVTTSARAILLISLIPVLTFLLYGTEILALTYGADFSKGAVPLSVLAIGQLVNATMGSVGALLNMTGHERFTIKGVAIAAIFNIILNLILVPHYGMFGAALASAFALIIWNLILRYYVLKILNIEPSGLAFFSKNFKFKQ